MHGTLPSRSTKEAPFCTAAPGFWADHEPAAYYVEPAVVRMPGQTAVVEEETFAPILSSAVFTSEQAEAERVH